MLRNILRVSVSLAALLFAAGSVVAQETRATLSGTVSDSSGAVIVGAALKLANAATGVVFPATTNSAGQYRFLFVNPGTYKLTAEMAGFKNFERDNIQLQVSQSATIDVSLQVGTRAETVTVSTEAPLLDTEKVDRGVVIDKRRITDLPLNVRNPIMLASFSPGIVQTGGQAHLNPFSNSGISSWSVNGGLNNNTEFLMDGAPNNAYSGRENRIAYVPPADAVEEFKVMTGVYDAQYGRTGGGVVNVSVKSGTNAFHGSAYEFLKRTALNANTFSNNAKKLPRAGASLNQYGFTVGGPVRIPNLYNGKDKTFFFFAGEAYGEDLHYPNESIASVPTVEQKRGDFSKTFDNAGRLMTIYDPMTGRFEGSRWVRSPFPGNAIPAGRINPTSAKIASLYPDPNSSTPGSTPWQNNFVLSPNRGRFDFQNYTARVDHQFNSRHRMYGRWSWNRHESLRIKNAIPSFGADWQTGGKTNNGIVLDWVTTVSSSMVFNLRASLMRWQEDLPGYPFDFDATQWWPKATVAQLPIQARGGTRSYPTDVLFYHKTAQLPGAKRVPYIDVQSYRFLGSNSYLLEPTNVFSLQPNLVWIRRRHTVKAGLDFRVTRFTQQQPNYAAGRLNFDRGFTRSDYLVQDAVSGNAVASLLLGYPASGLIDNNVFPYFQTLYYAPWVQDDIKLTRKLTINLGLRWDLNLPLTERFNRINRGFLAGQVNPISARIDQSKFPGYKAKGGIGFGGVNGMPRSPFDNDRNNIQPRVGAAYQLTPKTVLRGGWGIFYLSPVSRGANNGFSLSTPVVATLDSGRTPTALASDPFPAGVLQPTGSRLGMETFLGQGPNFSNTGARVPYVHQFSFGFQWQLPFNMTVDVSYVGSRTRSALVSKAFNEISLEALALGDSTKGGNPNYLNERLPNPFENLMPGTSLNTNTVSRQQLLRPYPQFSGFDMLDRNEGRTWYNAFQLALEKRYSHGLTVAATYTFSKNIEALSYLNAQDAAPGRTLTAWDRPQRVTIAPMYQLPFGPGRRFMNSSHPVLSRLAGGWQVVLTSIMQSGAPMSMPGNVYLLGDPRLENPAWDRMFKTGVIDANGTVRNVLPGEQPVYQVRQSFTLRTTPLRYGNLRNQWGTTFDFSVIKDVRVREGFKAQFRVEAFNVLNTPVFSANPDLTPTSVNFGKLFRDNGQSNGPRIVQLGIRLEF
ncbi:MAG: TonB-dependent receptor [Acidobacteria bacterium]|nr:TonB-dependent receptor [Acidobacteriota bacterium]